MFEIFCPAEQKHVLLSTRNIIALKNTGQAIELRYRCHCGHEDSLMTGNTMNRAGTAGFTTTVVKAVTTDEACLAGTP